MRVLRNLTGGFVLLGTLSSTIHEGTHKTKPPTTLGANSFVSIGVHYTNLEPLIPFLKSEKKSQHSRIQTIKQFFVLFSPRSWMSLHRHHGSLAKQSGRTGSQLQMNWLSLRNNRLKFKTAFMKITDHCREIYRILPNLIKENRRMSTCNRLGLQTLGSQPIMPKNLPLITDPQSQVKPSLAKPT